MCEERRSGFSREGNRVPVARHRVYARGAPFATALWRYRG